MKIETDPNSANPMTSMNLMKIHNTQNCTQDSTL